MGNINIQQITTQNNIKFQNMFNGTKENYRLFSETITGLTSRKTAGNLS